jgi:hypothetical protein
MTSGPEQQTARVNIGDEHWRQFRILAIESDRSVAEYLGQLVRDELRRSRRRKRRAEEEAEPGLGNRLAGATRGDEPKGSVRLADAQLLTELPSHDGSSRRSP